jgi:hypothetical protein
MVKRFRISWTERHSAWVEATDDEDAVNKALTESCAPTCDAQCVDEIRESQEPWEYEKEA